MPGIVAGKRFLITGVITDASIAFHVAALAQREGARVVLTGHGRIGLVERIARRLPEPAPVIELDVADTRHLDSLTDRVGEHLDGPLDGLLHSIAYAPPTALGGNFLTTPWEDVATTLRVSAHSLHALTTTLLPVFAPSVSVVALDFDAGKASPGYDWMGVAKTTLESCARYLAASLGSRGVRVNLVAAGPLNTMASRAIPGFDGLGTWWENRAPLGWSTKDHASVARACVALMSDWLPATTGEIVHADGGAHVVAQAIG
ncbi:enoyl-ACP reductase FabI [Actinoallomurus iriomotensis]|uniref:Enoyl-[acyl-carrier-protein] reductase [NADH] n=1 Tax=Actinoallomurus iriomotensis TaxID=478107 RepID=A0A9W6RIR7_9ACTN|nr:enoyl-ACP reductase FabI [Actinoallomurus iriomotensis]GLY74802.1 enoyl-[acyl-carrier-protein] reductase [NADH] [Actinoallomurus iriomotensis]